MMIKFLVISAAALLAALNSADSQTITAYQYDALGRLTVQSSNDGTSATYQLDPAGNRTAVSTLNAFQTFFEAETLGHVVGFAEGNGWAVDTSTASGFMIFGPYTNSVPQGQRVAAWRMMIDNNGDNQDVAHIEVYDATTGETLALRGVLRSEWQQVGTYQTFELPFTIDAAHVGHALEFRVLHFSYSHIRVDKAGYR